MLSLMWSAPQSAAGLARSLGISHGLASQHLHKLATAGLVELAEVRTKRGGLERLYGTVHGRHLSSREDAAPLIAEALAANLRFRAHHRAPGAGVTVDADLWIQPEAWATFITDLAALADRLHEQAQPPFSPGAIPVGATIMAAALTWPADQRKP
jgi:predicted ArsR family transcriptional regulator